MADLKEDTVEIKTSIIMKVDAPPEDNNRLTSPGGSTNNFDDNDTAKNQSKPKKSVLATPKLNSNSFLSRSSVLSSPKLNSGVVLRPSQLGAKLDNKPEHTKNVFNPVRFNPFAKRHDDDSTNNGSSESPESSTSHAEPSNGDTNSIEGPKFVPLAVTEAATRVSTSTVPATAPVTSTPNFVFGQNLHERVIAESEGASGNEAHGTEPLPSTSCANANGTAELLFSSAVRSSTSADAARSTAKSLTESAREYEESRANKRKYEEVTVVTGEEDEKNVLQINCKLFAFDKSGNWQERGRGTLRLNDKEVADTHKPYTQSRLVVRTTGSLRVVLNTLIWAKMTVEKANPKNLRITAMDGTGEIKIFLIMANAEEINQLQKLLEARVRNEVERQKHLDSANSEPESKKQAIDTRGQ